MRLSESAPAILEALHRLKKKPLGAKPYVVVEHAAGGKPFVQFCGDAGTPITLDVPLLQQSLRRGYRDQRMKMTNFGVQMTGLTREDAADMAVHILKHGFGLTDEAEVEIKER
jgi:hypothetical protein